MKTIFLILISAALLFSQVTDKHKSVIARKNVAVGGVTVDTIATTFTINKDFELANIIADDFTSDITGWLGSASTTYHYNSDWNSIGRVNVLQDSATGTANVRTSQTVSAMTIGESFRLTLDYYVPSGNTTTDGVYVSDGGGTTTEIWNVQNVWTSIEWNQVAEAAVTSWRFYQIDGTARNTITVGDLMYLDNVYMTVFPSFTATGNHSFDSISTAPITGTYSGVITASGAGDGTTNYATLLTARYTTLIEGNDAYISFNALVSTTGVDVTMVIGGESNTWTGVDNVTEELLTWEFSVTASEVGEDILIYLSKAANIKIDDFGN